MRYISDKALTRLRALEDLPDLSGTKYRAIRHLARGGMGIVYLAEDTTLDRRVALKIVDAADSSGELKARLLREARILAKLEHPGIVPVHDVGTLPDGRVFYVMKFVEGERLDRFLHQVESLTDRLRIFIKICEAVAFAHARGILHRDLKPENIMVGPFGEVLVIDWGVAKILPQLAVDSGEPATTSPPPPTATPQAPNPGGPRGRPAAALQVLSPAETEHGAVLGTPGYMSPEQERGEIARIGPRADVFSLGAILHFILTSRPPSAGPDAETLEAPTGDPVPRELAAICRKAMSPDPPVRYLTAEEVAQDVARYLDGLPVLAYPDSLIRKAGRLISKHRTAVILVAVYLLMRVALIFWAGR